MGMRRVTAAGKVEYGGGPVDRQRLAASSRTTTS